MIRFLKTKESILNVDKVSFINMCEIESKWYLRISFQNTSCWIEEEYSNKEEAENMLKSIWAILDARCNF